MDRQAWFCPSCRKHHAPHVETCPGGDPWGLNQLPAYVPTHLQPPHDPCAECKGACGNAACPKRIMVTSAAAPFRDMFIRLMGH